MKVRDLISMLEDYAEDNPEIMIKYTANDSWKTELAAQIDDIEDGVVEHSAYHHMDKVVDPDKIPQGPEDHQRQVILLTLGRHY